MDKTTQRILQLREENNLTKTEFASKLGINRSTVTRYEMGELKPTLDVMIKLHCVFGVSLDWIAGVSEVKFAPTKKEIIEQSNKRLGQYIEVLNEYDKYKVSPEKLKKAIDLIKE